MLDKEFTLKMFREKKTHSDHAATPGDLVAASFFYRIFESLDLLSGLQAGHLFSPCSFDSEDMNCCRLSLVFKCSPGTKMYIVYKLFHYLDERNVIESRVSEARCV